jgi:hypothetical protein
MRTVFALLVIGAVIYGAAASCGESRPDNDVAQTAAESDSADFFDDGTRDGFEDDAHVEALRTQAFDLSQEVLGFYNQAGAYDPDAKHCAMGKAIRPKVARMEKIIEELDALGAADTSEFYGSPMLRRARYSLRVTIQFCS